MPKKLVAKRSFLINNLKASKEILKISPNPSAELRPGDVSKNIAALGGPEKRPETLTKLEMFKLYCYGDFMLSL
jgi:hypothetical protein